MDRAEKVIEKVNLWIEKMIKRVIKLADKQQKSLNKDVALLCALLQCKEKGLFMGIECEGIQIFLLNHGLRNLISLTKQDFRKGTVSDSLCDLFGKLTDETEEMSSDTYREKEGTNKEHGDDDKFYDSLDLKMLMKFKFH